MQPVAHAAVMFADVSGSTRLYETAGDAVAAAAIEGCLDLLKQKAEAAGGRVIRTIGDEVMAAFPTSDAAAVAAMDMQNGVAGLPPVGETQMKIRIGFNFGPVLERDGDVYGDTVNVAARLAGLAQKDQIITSQETAEGMGEELRQHCRDLYSIPLKGKENEVALCQLLWQNVGQKTAGVGKGTLMMQRPPASLRIRYRHMEIVLDDKRSTLSLGRDKGADVVIADLKASRNHCMIERRTDKFVLADHSSNGTYVTVQGDRELLVRRDEVTLRGNGWIAFGHPRANTDDVLEFFCE